MRKTGTKAEVWAGTAQHTAGKLTKDDLMLNASGKVVSHKQHENGKRQAASLAASGRKAGPAARTVHPDHREGHMAAQYVRQQHGKGLLGGILGGVLGPVLGVISPILGDLAPAIAASCQPRQRVILGSLISTRSPTRNHAGPPRHAPPAHGG